MSIRIDLLMGGRFPPYTAAQDKRLNQLTFPSFPARPSKKPVASGSSKWWGTFSLAIVIVLSAMLTKTKSIYLYLPGWLSQPRV